MADFSGLKSNAKLGFGIGIGLLLLGLVLTIFQMVVGKVRA